MSIKLNAQSGGSVALDAPTQTTSSADLTFKLPVADGSANQVIKTDGSGNLGWATGGKILQVVQKTDSSNYSTTNTSAYQQGPQSDTFNLANSSNKVLVTINFMIYADSRSGGFPSCAATIYRGSVASGTRLTQGIQPMYFVGSGGAMERYSAFKTLIFLDTPGGNTTYSLGFKQNNPGGNTAFIYGSNGNTQIILQEVAA